MRSYCPGIETCELTARLETCLAHEQGSCKLKEFPPSPVDMAEPVRSAGGLSHVTTSVLEGGETQSNSCSCSYSNIRRLLSEVRQL